MAARWREGVEEPPAPAASAAAAWRPRPSCSAWAVMDGVSGELLFSSEPNALCQIASLTKLMTMFVVLKQALSNPGLLHEWVLVSPEAASVGGTSADIRAGELYRVKDLLYGLMLPSGNDAANALSEYLGDAFDLPPLASGSSFSQGSSGAEALFAADGGHRIRNHPSVRFVAEMNRAAARLGMSRTRFVNAHGLSDGDTRARPVSCALDICVLARALRSGELRSAFGAICGKRCHSAWVLAVPAKLSVMEDLRHRLGAGGGGGAGGGLAAEPLPGTMAASAAAALRSSSGASSGGYSSGGGSGFQARKYPCLVSWYNTHMLLGVLASASETTAEFGWEGSDPDSSSSVAGSGGGGGCGSGTAQGKAGEGHNVAAGSRPSGALQSLALSSSSCEGPSPLLSTTPKPIASPSPSLSALPPPAGAGASLPPLSLPSQRSGGGGSFGGIGGNSSSAAGGKSPKGPLSLRESFAPASPLPSLVAAAQLRAGAADAPLPPAVPSSSVPASPSIVTVGGGASMPTPFRLAASPQPPFKAARSWRRSNSSNDIAKFLGGGEGRLPASQHSSPGSPVDAAGGARPVTPSAPATLSSLPLRFSPRSSSPLKSGSTSSLKLAVGGGGVPAPVALQSSSSGATPPKSVSPLKIGRKLEPLPAPILRGVPPSSTLKGSPSSAAGLPIVAITSAWSSSTLSSSGSALAVSASGHSDGSRTNSVGSLGEGMELWAAASLSSSDARPARVLLLDAMSAGASAVAPAAVRDGANAGTSALASKGGGDAYNPPLSPSPSLAVSVSRVPLESAASPSLTIPRAAAAAAAELGAGAMISSSPWQLPGKNLPPPPPAPLTPPAIALPVGASGSPSRLPPLLSSAKSSGTSLRDSQEHTGLLRAPPSDEIARAVANASSRRVRLSGAGAKAAQTASVGGGGAVKASLRRSVSLSSILSLSASGGSRGDEGLGGVNDAASLGGDVGKKSLKADRPLASVEAAFVEDLLSVERNRLDASPGGRVAEEGGAITGKDPGGSRVGPSPIVDSFESDALGVFRIARHPLARHPSLFPHSSADPRVSSGGGSAEASLATGAAKKGGFPSSGDSQERATDALCAPVPLTFSRSAVYEYEGGKTGITAVAGGCLVSVLRLVRDSASILLAEPAATSGNSAGAGGAVRASSPTGGQRSSQGAWIEALSLALSAFDAVSRPTQSSTSSLLAGSVRVPGTLPKGGMAVPPASMSVRSAPAGPVVAGRGDNRGDWSLCLKRLSMLSPSAQALVVKAAGALAALAPNDAGKGGDSFPRESAFGPEASAKSALALSPPPHSIRSGLSEGSPASTRSSPVVFTATAPLGVTRPTLAPRGTSASTCSVDSRLGTTHTGMRDRMQQFPRMCPQRTSLALRKLALLVPRGSSAASTADCDEAAPNLEDELQLSDDVLASFFDRLQRDACATPSFSFKCSGCAVPAPLSFFTGPSGNRPAALSRKDASAEPPAGEPPPNPPTACLAGGLLPPILIVVVLGSDSKVSRFTDTKLIADQCIHDLLVSFMAAKSAPI